MVFTIQSWLLKPVWNESAESMKISQIPILCCLLVARNCTCWGPELLVNTPILPEIPSSFFRGSEAPRSAQRSFKYISPTVVNLTYWTKNMSVVTKIDEIPSWSILHGYVSGPKPSHGDDQYSLWRRFPRHESEVPIPLDHDLKQIPKQNEMWRSTKLCITPLMIMYIKIPSWYINKNNFRNQPPESTTLAIILFRNHRWGQKYWMWLES